jgi:ligand-binding sensor domain-containing protein
MWNQPRATSGTRRRHPIACLLALLALGSAASAAEYPLRFAHLAVEDGLSNVWVRAILKDSRGFVWFGTANGLDRFDGTEVHTFRHEPDDPDSLPGSHVTALLEDGRGRFWIALAGEAAGLALFDRSRERFRHIPLDPTPLPRFAAEVRQLFEDSSGGLWVAASSGLYRLDPEQTRLSRVWGERPDVVEIGRHMVFRAAEDAHGQLWLACGTGLVHFDPETGVGTRWSTVQDGVEIPSPAGVTDVYVDERGFVWFISDGVGLVRLDPDTMRVRRWAPGSPGADGLPVRRPRRLIGDRRGSLYVGSEDAGLAVLDLATHRFTHYVPDPNDPDALSAASIWSLYLDDEDILWVGTFNGGVDIASPSRRRFGLMGARSGRLQTSSVGSVLEDHAGHLWIGTDGGGLHRVDRNTGDVTVYRHDPRDPDGLASDSVLALLEDDEQRIWIGMWQGGLQALDAQNGRFTTFRPTPSDATTLASPHVLALEQGFTGELLVGTLDAGVQILDRQRGRFAHLSTRVPGAGHGVVNTIVKDDLGNLWIGHHDAEYVDRETGVVTQQRLDAGRVFAIHPDRAGNVWFATRNGGLIRLSKATGEIARFTTSEGLPSTRVTGILEAADGSLWLGTSRGLVRVESSTGPSESLRFLHFDARDGLQGDEFRQGATFVSTSGEMYFGGPNGLSFFRPRDVGAPRHAARAALSRIRIFNRLVAADDPGVELDAAVSEASHLVLSPDQTMVSFEFAALEYRVPGKSLYRHRLEGFDADWSPPGRERRATYTNLPPGAYRFRVAVGRDGSWNEDALALEVVRAAHVYETGAFRAALVTLSLAAGFGVHRLRLARHRSTERALQARFDEAMAEVKALSGLLPICAWCRRVRNDEGYWSQIETFVKDRSEAEFAESTCPGCAAGRGREEAGAQGSPGR